MINEIKNRQKELFEHLSVMHILSIMITLLGIILYREESTPLVTSIIFCFLALNLIWMVVLFYGLRDRLLKQDFKSVTWLNILYVSFPLVLAIGTLYFSREHVLDLRSIMILPVLFTASMMGKRAGLTMALISSVYLTLFVVWARDMVFFASLETNLIIIGIMFIVGWFVGVLIDDNLRYQERLEENILSLNQEVELRKAAEEENEKLSSVVEQSPNVIMILDIDGNIEYVNPGFTQVSGYLKSDTIGKPWQPGGINPSEFKKMWQKIRGGGVWYGEFSNRKKDGGEYWEYATVFSFKNPAGAITHFIKIGEDISERKRVEKEMQRLERLHLVGEMAAGISHEVRNPITTVRGFIQLLEKKEGFEKYQSYFSLIVGEIDRANSIITEYLSLARNRVVDFEMCNLNDIINTIYPLILADAMNSDRNVSLELGDVPNLYLNEKEIRQLVLNLVRNGMEAMAPGGCLTISTWTKDEKVTLSVRDEGCGVSPEILKKIGDPFFTTKEHGTGLGLSVCASIATRHGAEIDIETKTEGENTGTTFKVIFREGYVLVGNPSAPDEDGEEPPEDGSFEEIEGVVIREG